MTLSDFEWLFNVRKRRAVFLRQLCMAIPFWFFYTKRRYENISTGTITMASNASGVGKNRDRLSANIWLYRVLWTVQPPSAIIHTAASWWQRRRFVFFWCVLQFHLVSLDRVYAEDEIWNQFTHYWYSHDCVSATDAFSRFYMHGRSLPCSIAGINLILKLGLMVSHRCPHQNSGLKIVVWVWNL